MQATNNILIIGAFDRYNYGDLLFPLVIEQQLATYGHPFNASFFGIQQSDLRALGGKPTADIDAFYRHCDRREGHTSVIVAGGEAVAVTWSSLLLSLNRAYKLTHRFHHRLGRFVDLNKFAKWVLRGRTDLPFVFTQADFAGVDRVILNSLGGSELDPSLFDRYPALAGRLRGADYFAVRDKATVENLRQRQVPARLYPDSAILMSKFYPNEVLAKRVSPQVADFVAQKRGRYVFFQVKDNHAKRQEAAIARQLDDIADESGLELCFCPIGKALNHDDHLALARIAPLLKRPCRLFDDVSIWDIMYLIANARVYVGTSLHGAITAMSFAVPYVGIAVKKLDSYLRTWGVSGIDGMVPITGMAAGTRAALAVDRSALDESRLAQLVAAEESFDNIQRLTLLR